MCFVLFVCHLYCSLFFFFFKQKTAYEIGLGIPAEPLFRSDEEKWLNMLDSYLNQSLTNVPSILSHFSSSNASVFDRIVDRKSGSAGMPRPISYAVFCLKKKNNKTTIIKAPRNQ